MIVNAFPKLSPPAASPLTAGVGGGVGPAEAASARVETLDAAFGNVGLAPMEGVSDLPLRLWISQTSAPDFAVTPFLRVTRDYPAKRIAATYAPEISRLRGSVNYRLLPQLMGPAMPDLMRVAESLLIHAPLVDFNCGCPSPTVVGNGAGSALLETESTFDAYLSQLCRALGPENVSVKMRIGFHHADEFAALAGVVVKHAPKRVTIHGRTRAQRYLGRADWDAVALLARQAPSRTQVVGSGDVVDSKSYLERMGHSGPRVIVGRGALRNPWIFEELRRGQRVSLRHDALLRSLEAYALLQHLFEADAQGLLAFVEESGLFLGCAGTSREAWTLLRDALAARAGLEPHRPEDWVMARGAFARVKMLWNSMRSGLPRALFAPGPLRAPDVGSFLSVVAHGLKESAVFEGAVADVVEFVHHADLDWVYSGGKEQV